MLKYTKILYLYSSSFSGLLPCWHIQNARQMPGCIKESFQCFFSKNKAFGIDERMALQSFIFLPKLPINYNLHRMFRVIHKPEKRHGTRLYSEASHHLFR